MPLEGGLVALELAGTTQVLSKCLQGAPGLLETPTFDPLHAYARVGAVGGRLPAGDDDLEPSPSYTGFRSDGILPYRPNSRSGKHDPIMIRSLDYSRKENR
jgi:hypothetical protein